MVLLRIAINDFNKVGININDNVSCKNKFISKNIFIKIKINTMLIYRHIHTNSKILIDNEKFRGGIKK